LSGLKGRPPPTCCRVKRGFDNGRHSDPSPAGACNRQRNARRERKGSRMQVVLSPDILSSIRHHASRTLGAAKSSHVAEALAAALGHRTNASLISWLKAKAVSETAVTPFD